MYPQSYVLSKKKKNITNFHLKITIFTGEKNHSIKHRRVIVMSDLWLALFSSLLHTD